MFCVKEDSEMAKRIITISREFGSGGRFIGEEVAKKLGIEELLEKYPYEIFEITLPCYVAGTLYQF